MRIVKDKILAILCILILVSNQAKAESAAVDFLRSTGKIYSVVAVIVLIFLGIVFYLWRIDKKLNNLEKHIKDE